MNLHYDWVIICVAQEQAAEQVKAAQDKADTTQAASTAASAEASKKVEEMKAQVGALSLHKVEQ